uniref:Uncharacterized protein n=1 Tax=viral metagenome TaxID=1070528 RepID=A0A6C0IZY7_9ZZZZ
MASKAFNELVGNICVGLMNDARIDDAYETVLPFHELYATTVENNDEEYLQMKFIALIRNSVTLRKCLREQDNLLLETIACQELPSLNQTIKILALRIDDPKYFKEDATKKLWSKIKKLVVKHCNLHDVVYADDTQNEVTTVKSSERLVDLQKERAIRFNNGYRTFLSQVSIAFPTDKPLLEQFDKDVAENTSVVLVEYKKLVLPILPKFAGVMQKQNDQSDVPTRVTRVFDEYFSAEDSSWFQKLPYMSQLNIDDFWRESIGANRLALQRALGELTLCMSGIDALFYSPIVNALRKKAVEIMQRPDMKGTVLSPTQQGFDKDKLMSFAMEMFQSLPEATNYQISMTDIQNLIMCAFTGGSVNIPESFEKVFSPDILDEDCIDSIMTWPGVGDLLSPIMAMMEGQKTGHTGKPAFNAIPSPAWLKKE